VEDKRQRFTAFFQVADVDEELTATSRLVLFHPCAWLSFQLRQIGKRACTSSCPTWPTHKNGAAWRRPHWRDRGMV